MAMRRCQSWLKHFRALGPAAFFPGAKFSKSFILTTIKLQALVAPLSGGAAAARAALLGARNALEPERYEDRRLAQ